MPNSPAVKGLPREETGIANTSKYSDGQDQEAPKGHNGKTFLEQFRESMDEHETLVRLLAQ